MDDKHFSKNGLFDSIVKQMAAKLGWRPWLVQTPNGIPAKEVTMMIGADVYHKSGRESVAAVIGTMNKDFSKYFSTSKVQPKRGTEIMSNIADMVLECVEKFVLLNKRVPTTIIFYRDGVGKGQYELVQNIEITRIKTRLVETFGDKAPRLDFILVNKRINNRFYQDAGSAPTGGYSKPQYGKTSAPASNGAKNPDSGTMVLEECTSDTHLDFFMVAQNVTQGTATPTHYTFLEKESNFDMDTILSMTYFQTYNYYNWSGPVKVPAVCQYAHKLAYMLGETNKGTVHSDLALTPWYL
jgi:aubergine-like protein